jgi:hypothetical protein
VSASRYLAEHALIDKVWQHDALIEVDAQGMITGITTDAAANDAEPIAGCVLPGMPNLHSHAFQRALVINDDDAIFGPVRRVVRDVMVGSQWRVRDGRHAAADASKAAYRASLKRLLAR